MKIYSGSSNKPLAQAVADYLKHPLSPLEHFIFPDGERRIRIEDGVLDQDVILVQSTCTPVDQNYMEMLFIADALNRSGARSVTVVTPYLGYQRQDHVFRDGEAVSLEVMVRLIEAIGIDHVISFDLHSIKIPELFHIPITHLSALPLFAQVIKKKKWTAKDTVLIAPDKGGIRRIKILSELLGGMPYACIDKNRDLATGSIEAAGIEGTVTKRAIIVDDMFASGGTTIEAAKLLKEKGAKEIYAFATHAVFAKEAPQYLQNSEIEKIYVTDAVFIPEEKCFPKLEVISIAKMIAENIKTSV
jgi:ribose-phosphate pyrophosphokinase